MKKSDCVLLSVIWMTLPVAGEAKMLNIHLSKPSKTFSFGSSTQIVKPKFAREVVRPDGSRSIVFGQQSDSTGKIVGAHGHTVLNKNGSMAYSRTQGGRVILDDKKGMSNK